MSPGQLSDRVILEIGGEDARSFLQGLVTNDIRKLQADNALYAALLTPQGKIICDFLIYETGSSILLDCQRSRATDLQQRLSRYRLRARVEIRLLDEWSVEIADYFEQAGETWWRDPRHPELGWRTTRKLTDRAAPDASAEYLARRLELGIPEGSDLGCERMFALDADLEELHAISFDKGCYVGQELTARMKHRGTARKKLVPIVASPSSLLAAELPVIALEQEIGTLAAVYGSRGFALLRLDRLEESAGAPLSVGGIPVEVERPEWLFP